MSELPQVLQREEPRPRPHQTQAQDGQHRNLDQSQAHGQAQDSQRRTLHQPGQPHAQSDGLQLHDYPTDLHHRPGALSSSAPPSIPASPAPPALTIAPSQPDPQENPPNSSSCSTHAHPATDPHSQSHSVSYSSCHPDSLRPASEYSTPQCKPCRPKSLRPFILSVMAFKEGCKFSTATSMHRKGRMRTIVEKEDHFGQSLAVRVPLLPTQPSSPC